ncbi:hypothetical protein Tco_0391595, partial [Tanacetum coccineum]
EIETKDKDMGIIGPTAVGPARLWRCWPRQSSTWYIFGMLQVSSPERSYRMPEMSAR